MATPAGARRARGSGRARLRAVARGRDWLAARDPVSGWYEAFATGLAAGDDLPDPLAADIRGDERLVSAVARDLRDGDGQGTATGVRVIWTGDHLDAVRRLQAGLVGPARAAAAEHVL